MTCIRTSADAFRDDKDGQGEAMAADVWAGGEGSLVTGTTDVTAIHRRTEPCFLAWSISQCTHNTHRQGEKPPNCRTTNRPSSSHEPVSPRLAPTTWLPPHAVLAPPRSRHKLHLYYVRVQQPPPSCSIPYIYTNTGPRCLTRINEIQWGGGGVLALSYKWRPDSARRNVPMETLLNGGGISLMEEFSFLLWGWVLRIFEFRNLTF